MRMDLSKLSDEYRVADARHLTLTICDVSAPGQRTSISKSHALVH